MDKLSASQRTEIKKLTNLRLSAKLLDAGIEEDVVAQMDRPALLNAWAEMVAAGKDKTSGVPAETVLSTRTYDVEVEKQRLELERELRLKEIALREKELEEKNEKKIKSSKRKGVEKNVN